MIKQIKNIIKLNAFKIVNQHEKIKKIDNLERQLRRMSLLLYDLYPDEIILNQECLNVIRGFEKDNNITKDIINFTISKRDLMFQYWLYHSQSISEALFEYLRSGLIQSNILKKIIKARFSNFSGRQIFDFASGHGRITRFLVTDIDKDNIWISEIKQSAVDFQNKEFGVNGLLSAENPDEFEVLKKFDVIVVSSLFTHLPEELFKRWLKKLYSILSDTGILAISILDIGNLKSNKVKESDFIFFPSSEEGLFFEVEESLNQRNSYGTTYISESKFRELIDMLQLSNVEFIRYPKGWINQDLYLIAKNSTDDLKNLQLY